MGLERTGNSRREKGYMCAQSDERHRASREGVTSGVWLVGSAVGNAGGVPGRRALSEKSCEFRVNVIYRIVKKTFEAKARTQRERPPVAPSAAI